MSPTLPDEVTKKQSSRAQQLAALPSAEIKARLDREAQEDRRASQATDAGPSSPSARPV